MYVRYLKWMSCNLISFLKKELKEFLSLCDIFDSINVTDIIILLKWPETNFDTDSFLRDLMEYYGIKIVVLSDVYIPVVFLTCIDLRSLEAMGYMQEYLFYV